MNRSWLTILVLPFLITSCSGSKEKEVTIAALEKKKLVIKEVKAKPLKREKTAGYYKRFLAIAPAGTMYGNALRRLADINLQTAQELSTSSSRKKRQRAQKQIREAIRLYRAFLQSYPGQSNNDMVLYQLAKAYELNMEPEKMLATLNLIVQEYPQSEYIEEIQFRRGEAYFISQDYANAEIAYRQLISNYPDSSYFEKSLYKYGWSKFKLLDYPAATDAFIRFLDRKYQQKQLLVSGPSADISRSDRELIEDILRVISLSFSYQQGYKTVNNYFSRHGNKPYEPLLYSSLAELYINKTRILDAANTYLAYSKRYPTSSLAPGFHSKAIEVYRKGGFISMIVPAKISFVEQYGVNTPYWKVQNEKARKEITPLIKRHIRELATHFHALARADRKQLQKKAKNSKKLKQAFAGNITQATKWYRLYIHSFPTDTDSADINFLLAEAHQDAGQYRNAIYQFEKTAYQYPGYKKQAEAAYAALLLYDPVGKKLNAKEKNSWQQKKISSALKFADSFPQNRNTPQVLANTADLLFKIQDYPRAIATAEKLGMINKLNKKLYISALLVIGHSNFEMRQYNRAEDSYRKLLKLIPAKDKQYRGIYDRLAATIYKQGEMAKNSNKLAIAAEFFLRIGKELPASRLVASSDYDAATLFIQLEKWKRAEKILEAFRKKFPPKHKLQFGVTEKLALVYSKTGRAIKAANEMVALAKNTKHYSVDQRRQLLWDAAKIYNENKRKKTARKILADYVRNYPSPLEQAIEARQLLADFNKKSNRKQYYYWLREIIKADNRGGKQRTRRTHYLAAKAYMELTLPLFRSYQRARLTIPLKRSLKKKKVLMEKVVKSYDNAMKYRVAEITTAATFYIAEIYNDFASALLDSQRPKNLNADELEEYNLLIEEQAFPFEEKAIDIHAANAERVKDNIYDKWVKRSIAALAKLNPARYAKQEKTENYVTLAH